MWFFRQKIGIDYLRQIILVAEKVQKDLSAGKTKNILPFLKTIAKIDYDSIDNLIIEMQSPELAKQVKVAYRQVIEAVEDISKNSYKKTETALNTIIALQALINKGRPRVIYQEKGIDYIYVDKQNWPLYREGVVKLEELHFGETELKEEPEDFDAYVNDKNSVVIVAVKDNKVIGFTIGEPLEQAAGTIGVDDDPAFRKGTGLYVSATEVLPEYANKAIAYFLRTLLAQTAAKKGYKTLSSNNREGVSTRNALRMGGKVFKRIPNYYETGETYYYIIVDLRRFK